MTDFNPNDVGVANGNIFGLPYTADESELIIIPVPTDITCSFNKGTAKAPQRIVEASLQVDLFVSHLGELFPLGSLFLTGSNGFSDWKKCFILQTGKKYKLYIFKALLREQTAQFCWG